MRVFKASNTNIALIKPGMFLRTHSRFFLGVVEVIHTPLDYIVVCDVFLHLDSGMPKKFIERVTYDVIDGVWFKLRGQYANTGLRYDEVYYVD